MHQSVNLKARVACHRPGVAGAVARPLLGGPTSERRTAPNRGLDRRI